MVLRKHTTRLGRDAIENRGGLTSPQRGLYTGVMILGVSREEYMLLNAQRRWTHWLEEDAQHMAHPFDSELETYLDAQGVRYRVRRAQGSDWATRKH